MTSALVLRRAGPGLTLQDGGRTGFFAQGISPGGAVDRLALIEAAALLGCEPGDAVLEMAGFGGLFEATGDLRVALTGAPMRASLNGEPLEWNACHRLREGDALDIGAAQAGIFGYLALGGGIDVANVMGSRSTHLLAGIGRRLGEGDRLDAGSDPRPERTGLRLEPGARFAGGTVRLIEGPQTRLFDSGTRERFIATAFRRDPRGNRQGARLLFDGEPFRVAGQLDIVSEIITAGDVQIAGDGSPFVLMPECQTIGGYPRIASVVPDDLAIVAQAAPGTVLRFEFIDAAAALDDYRRRRTAGHDLAGRVRPLVRDPASIPDLLGYQLISGATAGEDLR